MTERYGWARFFPSGEPEPDAAAEVGRVLRMLYRRATVAPHRIPTAILEAMEAEGLLAWIEGSDDEPGYYCLTAEGHRAARRAAMDASPTPAGPASVFRAWWRRRKR